MSHVCFNKWIHYLKLIACTYKHVSVRMESSPWELVDNC